MKALVNKIYPVSYVDGPGNRMAIFLQGCHFHCLYCHNPETVNVCVACGNCIAACPSDALSWDKKGEGTIAWESGSCTECDECIRKCPHMSSPKVNELSSEDIMKLVRKSADFISGITISGGEATRQLPFVIELFEKVKSEFPHLSNFLDTNGDFDIDPKLLPLLDAAMIDLKCFTDKHHRFLTGNRSNERVLKNIEILSGLNKIYEIRTVIVPKILSEDEWVQEITLISEFLKKINSKAPLRLIPFHSQGVKGPMSKFPPPSEELMTKLMAIHSQK